MSKNLSLNNVQIWRKSLELSKSLIPKIGTISNLIIRDQITRCLLSIPSNIAEGYGRHSKRDFSRFLKISLGSCYELISQLEIIRDSVHAENIEIDKTIQATEELCAQITSFIKYLDKTEN